MHLVDSQSFENHQMDGPEGLVKRLFCFNVSDRVCYAPNSLVGVEDLVYLLVGFRDEPAGPIVRLAKRRIGADTGALSVAIPVKDIKSGIRSDGRPVFTDSQVRTITRAFGLEIGMYRRLVQEALFQIPV